MSGEELRALAEAARDSQPPAWDFEEERETGPGLWFDPDALSSRNVVSEPDSRFIAAANPTAVLALLDERDALRAQVERVDLIVSRWEREVEERGIDGHNDTLWTHGATIMLRAALDGPQ